MQLDNFKKALEEFRDKVIEESKQNLRKIGKGGGTLENSIKGSELKVTDRSLNLKLKMADYGVFQDKGVSGVKQKYNTPYSYTTKMPPPSKLDKWIVKKGIAPRTSSGKFKGRTISKVGFAKSIQFLIARSIFYKGIKPSLFFTKPFQKYAKGLPKELETAFALDTEALLAFVTKQQLNNK
jgi:hypothetical protein